MADSTGPIDMAQVLCAGLRAEGWAVVRRTELEFLCAVEREAIAFLDEHRDPAPLRAVLTQRRNAVNATDAPGHYDENGRWVVNDNWVGGQQG